MIIGRVLAACSAVVFVACTATEGALLVRIQPDAGAPPPSATIRPVQSNMVLHYQITGTLDTQSESDLFVSDLFDTSTRQVSQLQATNTLAMAYVSVGSLENWRPDVSKFPRSAVGMPLASYPNENWLDPRRPEVRASMEARFDLARERGFEGVFASTLGAYRTSSGFDLTRDDEIMYARFLAEAAHARELSIGLSGDFELSAELVRYFDWAIAEGCVARNTCQQLAPLVAAGLAVWSLETEGDQAAVCSAAAAQGISVAFKRRGDGAYRSTCP